jgi:TonB family protein
MELLHQATFDVKLFSLVPLGAALLFLPILGALRFYRRGPARFWLAPSFLLFALLPMMIGAAISAWHLTSAREIMLFGVSAAALTAVVQERQLPLLAGLLGSAVLLLLSLLLIAVSRSPAGSDMAVQPRKGARILTLPLLFLVAAIVILHVAAARGIASGSAGADGLAWWTAVLAIVVTILLFSGGILLAATAPAGAATSPTRVLHLGALAAAAVVCSVGFFGGVTAATREVPSFIEMDWQPHHAEVMAATDTWTPPSPSAMTEAELETRTEETPRQPLRIGTDILDPPRKLHHVDPEYPLDARRARLEGAVTLECTISPEGEVSDIRVVKGHPLLDQAAIEAVRLWKFAPTLVDGTPVPVLMSVTVRFTLS